MAFLRQTEDSPGVVSPYSLTLFLCEVISMLLCPLGQLLKNIQKKAVNFWRVVLA